MNILLKIIKGAKYELFQEWKRFPTNWDRWMVYLIKKGTHFEEDNTTEELLKI